MGAGCCGTIPGAGPGACTSGCDSNCGQCDACTGCGELYVDPWINHPADCVDPCDACGNFNGQSCGKCRSIFAGYKSLWGYRFACDPPPTKFSDRCFAPSCSNGCGGCDTCGVVEPTCGCEGPCDCGRVAEPGCGLEPACGLEPGCGLEPTCGCEGPCDCSAPLVSQGYGPPGDSPAPFVEPPVIESPVIESPVIESPVIESPGVEPQGAPASPPRRSRSMFTPRKASGRGFLNEFRR
jgi:hypothetical protein